jgi:hypothetical protein
MQTELIINDNKDDHNSNTHDLVGLLDSKNTLLELKKYDFDTYISHVNQYGLEVVWANILRYVKDNGQNDFLNTSNFGELYEAGLAEQDKGKKKKSGQYYTPLDVCDLMSNWLYELDGYNICDVGCGTGNLILSYLDLLGYEQSLELLKHNRIYLYDFDRIAITIAKYSIAFLYGVNYLENINIIYGDFLDDKIALPKNAKIISNPPYAKFSTINDGWLGTSIQNRTKELYAAFMEKIISSGNTAVIITPYSFLGGSKFQPLRDAMNNYNGYIVAFDNVPGNIFNGKKHGIFNTNTANSVRAAITVVENKPILSGFKTTHLIRFKNKEREKLLKSIVIKKLLSKNRQIISKKNKMYARCHVQLEDCFLNWKAKSTTSVKDFASEESGNYKLYMPNTCRYFTTASNKKLKRGGYMTISFNDLDKYNFMYCLINSSFVYWWWRIYDGGITYPKGLFNNVPIFFDLLSDQDKKFFSSIAGEMIRNEEKYIITKLNAGVVQENIKFPKKYRDAINRRLLDILSCQNKIKDFDLVHSNSFFND